MSRKRNAVDGTRAQMELAEIDIVCSAQHRRIGQVLRDFLADSDEPHFGVTGGITFEDVPEPTEGTGRVRGRCSTCREDVQIRWSRVVEEFDRLAATNRHTGELRP